MHIKMKLKKKREKQKILLKYQFKPKAKPTRNGLRNICICQQPIKKFLPNAFNYKDDK